MKFLIVTIVSLIFSFSASAEHDKTYCGTIQAPINDDHIAIFKVPYLKNTGEFYEDDFVTIYSYAEIYHVDEGTKSLRNLKKFLKSKSKAEICIKARWGGSLFDHNLGTDSVYRLDYKSKFKGQDLD